MPSPIRMPSLPSGARRAFVEFLFDYYRMAGRPTLREITAYISDHDLPGTASKETIRRVLQGTRVPVQWQTAEAIFLALCALAHTDPESTYWDDQINYYSARVEYRQRWNNALDEGEPDPWGSAPPPSRSLRGFDDEPPF